MKMVCVLRIGFEVVWWWASAAGQVDQSFWQSTFVYNTELQFSWRLLNRISDACRQLGAA